ncbi:hypothetical protein CTKA_01283 [Chthonomonas calidirosea]|uniref:DUF4412 domain-containing protein n=1 Tax=Chthonomonas calidirosea (strain DSM 23976 / ICMP 18418 / T49) TaxID=1303518 RepID=S0EXF2_CHTCT|nr:hypothetical protein [Chthonomonas calidirosea]CCW36591.1 hypothetical protein CCALI_02806 [Chthonomonas calidirosea T49]CEK16875.1 hypothetical protein CTKA_01283 [Chthonomonas calidirosea]
MSLRTVCLGMALSCLIGTTALVARAQDTSQTQGAGDQMVTLAYKFEKGATVTMKTVAHVMAADGSSQVTYTTTAQRVVKEVKPDGSVVITVTPGSASVDLGSGPQPTPPPPPFSVTFDKQGRLVMVGEKKEDDTSPIVPQAAALLEASVHVVLPDHPVKPGDTWQSTFDNPLVKGKQVTLKDTYDGMVVYQGRNCWKVEQTLEAATDDMGTMMTVKTTVYMNPTDGSTVYAKSSLKNLPTLNYGPISWESETTLVADTGNKNADGSAKP